MTEIFTHIDQISPEWLTECMRSNGCLSKGRVIALSGTQKESITAFVGQMTVEYSADASPNAPRKLFLKTGHSNDPENDDWEGEVFFYNHIARDCSSVAIPCYHAAYAPNPARFHILLEDLTASHTGIPWPLLPTPEQYLQIVGCLAALHVPWWSDPRLGVEVKPRFSEITCETSFPIWEEQLKHYFDFLGDRLLPRRKKLYEWAMPRLLTRIEQRRQSKQHLTIVHQDAHPYNFLFPKDRTSQATRLVDWATWEVEFGARDLAYLIALHSFPEQRASIEKPLLHQYHDCLLSGGVTNYSWEQLWEDYRLFAALNILIPIEQFCWKVPARVWWFHAERSLLAFDDLNCIELLK
jgi:thiamine kinase-like enzyme